MFDPDAGLDTAVPEYDIQELGQLACRDLDGIADDSPEALAVPSLEALDPSEHVVPDYAFRHLVSRELDSLLDADVLSLGTRLFFTSIDSVGYGETVPAKEGFGSAGFLNDHLRINFPLTHDEVVS